MIEHVNRHIHESVAEVQKTSKQILSDIESRVSTEMSYRNSVGHEIFFAAHDEDHPLHSLCEHPEEFFTVLHQTIKELRMCNTDDADRRAQNIAHGVKSEMFSGSPNLFNHLSLPKMLLWASKVRRDPDLSSCIGREAIGELVYELSFVRNPQRVAKAIIDTVRKESLSTTLDLIDQLADIRGLAEHESYAEQAQDITEHILHTIQKSFPQAFIQAAARYSLDRDLVKSDIRRERLEQTAAIETHVQPDRSLAYDHATSISPASIAYCDAGGTPHHIATIAKDALSGPAGVNERDVRDLISFVSRESLKHLQAVVVTPENADDPLIQAWNTHVAQSEARNMSVVQKTIAAYEHRIVQAPVLEPTADAAELLVARARRWRSIAPVLSESEWLELFTTHHQLDLDHDERDRQLSEEMRIVERRNYRASIRFGLLAQAAARLLENDATRTGKRLEMITPLTTSLDNVSKESISEHAFASAQHVARLMEDPGIFDPSVLRWDDEHSQESNRKFIETHKRMHDDWVAWQSTLSPATLEALKRAHRAYALMRSIHHNSWDRAKLLQQKPIGKSEIVQRNRELWSTIESRVSIFQDAVYKHLQQVHAATTTGIPRVHPEPILERVHRELVDPHKQTDPEAAAGLLQYLHKPHMDEWISKVLGMRFQDIPLYVQIHFAQFLIRATPADIDRVRLFTSEYGLDGIHAFFATGIDIKAASEVLSLGEIGMRDPNLSSDVHEIFRRVATIVQSLDTIESYFLKTFGRASEGLIHKGREQVLLRVRGVIQQAHEHRQRPHEPALLIRSLDTEIRVFGDLAALYVKAGYQLEDVIGVRTLSRKGGEMEEAFQNAYKKMHAAGYTGRDDYSSTLVDMLDATLANKMKDPNTTFKLLVLAGAEKPIAGLRFDYEYDGAGTLSRIHLASVTANKSLEGSKVGMLHTETQIRAQMVEYGVPLYAECDQKAGITQKYIEWGLCAKSTGRVDTLNTINIEWDPAVYHRLTTVAEKVSQEEIVRRAGAIVPPTEPAETPKVRYFAGVNPPNFDEYFGKGYLMTRFFSRKQKDGSERFYAVFEFPTS